MKYMNTKTGAVINSASSVSGGNWIEVKEVKPAKKRKAKESDKK